MKNVPMLVKWHLLKLQYKISSNFLSLGFCSWKYVWHLSELNIKDSNFCFNLILETQLACWFFYIYLNSFPEHFKLGHVRQDLVFSFCISFWKITEQTRSKDHGHWKPPFLLEWISFRNLDLYKLLRWWANVLQRL